MQQTTAKSATSPHLLLKNYPEDFEQKEPCPHVPKYTHTPVIKRGHATELCESPFDLVWAFP